MSAHERFAELWTDYLEGEIDDRGLESLHELMAADERLVAHAADLLQTHRLIGLVAAETPPRQDEFVRATMSQLPGSGDEFVNQVMMQVVPTGELAGQTTRPGRAAWWQRIPGRGVWIAATTILFAITLLSFWPRTKTPVDVCLAHSSHAKFFGELPPPAGSMLQQSRDYVLMSGLIEVGFPKGASAILEGPAVFRILSPDSLALDVGRCSVYAPDGAEGFQVQTPATRVVDRGTRFAVNVGESSDTVVQVIEGAADIYGRVDDGRDPTEVRLTDGEARRFATLGGGDMKAVSFDASDYRHQLPDRVLSYTATIAEDGGAENLTSVMVQRGGRITRVDADDFIAARLTWFKSAESRGFLCGNATLPENRTDMASTRSLVSGVINPGGSRQPLTADPVLLDGEAGTAGMAVRFDRPVVNGPGADVVFFDLQAFGNPPDGDAFHVSPLKFREGLKSHTIQTYDLTMESAETQILTSFHVHFAADAVESLQQLNTIEYSSQKQRIKFRGLAVGIDLSDLGYSAGETIEGLFIQDAMDDMHYVDPVFIAGLPEVK